MKSKGRWESVLKMFEKAAPFGHPDFEPGPENLDTLRGTKVLVVGAGGLGCELLKNLALLGFQNLHVIDMDTVDISNLNRQFLFRMTDVGRSKAEAAASFISRRVSGCNVTPYFCKIEEKDDDFYRSFNIIICGLDSVQARRWLNAMICGLLVYDADGALDYGSVIPLIDGGTEGFRGNARIILPGLTPCIECTLSLYPPQLNFPMCTIAHTPRLPEHCIEYARVIQWPKERPFADDEVDGDNTDHIQWLLSRAEERANEYGIRGVTYRLTQGVVKRIIPAVASTNAVIAAVCANEAFKLATNCAMSMNNYMNFQDVEGVYVGVVELERRDDCPVCSRKPVRLDLREDAKLEEVFKFLTTNTDLQMRNPSIYFDAKPLYVPTVPDLEQQTRFNLKKSLKELELLDGVQLVVADASRPVPLLITLVLTQPMDT